jgi:hypothetical protein
VIKPVFAPFQTREIKNELISAAFVLLFSTGAILKTTKNRLQIIRYGTITMIFIHPPIISFEEI